MKFIENLLPFYAKIIERYKKMFPTLNFNCPLKPGPFYVRNFTYDTLSPEHANYYKDNVGKSDYGMGNLPNGIYRNVVTLSTKTDPMVYKLDWQLEVANRLGEEQF
jgi:hypothetical protein